MASFQAKTSWKRPRNSKNKNYRSDLLLPDPLQRIPKKQQKNEKNEKTSLRLLFKPKLVGTGRERVKIKIIDPIFSCPLQRIPKKQQKNSKK